MKNKIICMAIILSLMLIIPFLAIENKENLRINFNTEKMNILYSKEDMYGFVGKKFKTEYSVETLKAITIILQSNYSYKEKLPDKNNNYIDKESFCKKYGSNGKKYYNRIKTAVNAVYGKVILHKGKKIYVPYRYVINSGSGTKYTYLKKSATPWDCLNKKYKSFKSSYGISLNTINQLCHSGFTYKEALNYFLNNTQIKETAP